MPSPWEEMYRMNNHFQKVLKNSTKSVPEEKPNEMHRAVHDKQQDSHTSDKEFNVAGTKAFNFQSIRLVLITKLRIKTSKSSKT